MKFRERLEEIVGKNVFGREYWRQECLCKRVWSMSARYGDVNMKHIWSRHDIKTPEFFGQLSTAPVPAVSTTDYSRRHRSCQVAELRNSDQMLDTAGATRVDENQSANTPPVLVNGIPNGGLGTGAESHRKAQREVRNNKSSTLVDRREWRAKYQGLSVRLKLRLSPKPTPRYCAKTPIFLHTFVLKIVTLTVHRSICTSKADH